MSDSPAPTRVINAVREDNYERVQKLLDDGANINEKDRVGRTALHYGAQSGNTKLIQLLIESGAILDHKDNTKCTPIRIAKIHEQKQAFKMLNKAYQGYLYLRVENGKAITESLIGGGERDFLFRILYGPKLSTGGKSLKSKKVPCNDPNWEHTFELRVKSYESFQKTKIRLSVETDLETLAFCWILAKDLKLENATSGWFRMQSEYKDNAGGIKVRMYYSRTKQTPSDLLAVWFKMNKADLVDLAESFSPWRRSRLMIVGKGRAGKTCIFRSLQGKLFKRETESTIIADVTSSLDISEKMVEGSKNTAIILEQRKRQGSAFARTLASGISRMGVYGSNRSSETRPAWVIVDDIPLDSKPGKSNEDEKKGNLMKSGSDQSFVKIDEKEFESEIQIQDVKTEATLKIEERTQRNSVSLSRNSLSVRARGSVSGNYRGSLSREVSSRTSTMRGTPANDPLKDITPRDFEDEIRRKDVVLSVWDFGGQEVFEAAHAVFLERNCVYLLAFSLEEWFSSAVGKAQASKSLEFWLEAINVHADGATFIIVGTHRDKLEMQYSGKEYNEALESCDKEILAMIKRVFGDDINDSPLIAKWRPDRKTSLDLHFIPVDNSRGIKDSGVSTLMSKIRLAFDNDEVANEDIPSRWARVCDLLTKRKENWMTYEVFAQIASGEQIDTDRETKMMLKKFHDLGLVIFFDEGDLGNTIVLKPNFLIEYIKRIIFDTNLHYENQQKSFDKRLGVQWKRFRDSGILHKKVHEFLWKDVRCQKKGFFSFGKKESRLEREFVLDLLVKYMLLTKIGPNEFLVPSMLPKENKNDKVNREVYETFELSFNSFVPRGFYSLLLSETIRRLQAPSYQKKLLNEFKPLDIKQCTFSLARSFFKIGGIQFSIENAVNFKDSKEAKVSRSIIARVHSKNHGTIIRQILKDVSSKVRRWPLENRVSFSLTKKK